MLLLKNFLLQDYVTYVNIIIYYSFCVKTGPDRLKPSQEIKGALQRWFWWSWYSCMSSLYGLFGEVSFSCTLPFSMLKKCKKKSMASSMILSSKPFSYTFPPRLSFCNFFTYWRSLFRSLHLYSCANSNQL